jgi:phosphatidylglycerophosphatase A
LPVAWGLSQLTQIGQYAAAAIVFAIGVPLCGRGAQLLHAKDPRSVVFDEIAAFPVMFLFAPFGLETAALGFMLFRLFDVAKPWPCRRAEELPGGWGIMVVDLCAGLYAGAVLSCIARWFALW